MITLLATSITLAAAPARLSAQMGVNPTQDPASATPNSSPTATFNLRTDDQTSTQFSIQVSCDGAVTSCSTSDWAYGSSAMPATITVSYTTAASGSGTITILATDQITMETQQGSMTVNVAGAQPVITANDATWYTDQNASTNYPWFHLQNGGSTAATYTLSVDCPGNISGCSVRANPGQIAPGSSADVIVDYHSGAAGSGNGTIRLTAQSPYGESASYSLTVVPLTAAVEVDPKGGPGSAEPGTSGVGQFTVTNKGTATPTTYTLACGYSGVVTSCSAPTNVQVYTGSPQNVNVGFTTNPSLAGGTGTLTLTATDNTGFNVYTDQGSFTITVPDRRTYTVAVTPKGATGTLTAGAASTYSFSVANSGNTLATYSLTVSQCTGAASSCNLGVGSVTVAPGQSVSVPVSFTAPAAGQAVQITLQASGTGTSDAASATLTAAGPLAVDLSKANFGKTVTRDRCLTVSVGRGAAYECGDLRLVHALPTVRTMNKARTPVLLYTSHHASPRPIVVADVTLPIGDAVPTTVQAAVNVASGAATATRSWNGSDWGSAGATRRIGVPVDASALATGAYPYTLTVTTQGSSGTRTQTAQDTLIVVNRANSSFGAGWWLAGVEQLVTPAMSSSMRLWVGGDGSARLYHQVSSTVWAAPAVDRPDSLTYDASTNTMTRWDEHRLRTVFDASGNHIQTITRTADTTRFTWSSGQLQSIAVPTPSGALAYTLGYAGGVLTNVSAPDGRQSRWARSGSTLTATDPDNTTVQFGYGASGNAITSRTDRRGNVVTYAYDASMRLDTVSINMGSGVSPIVTAFRSAESEPAGSTAQIADSVYTLVNGPRRDTTVARVWLDRFGEPVRIVDALGGATTLQRSDARFPALVTQLTGPTGSVTTASYDAHGNLATSVAVNPLGDGVSDTTRYVWDQTYDFPTQITHPLGELMTTAYDQTNGNRAYQYPGTDAARKVQYVYDPITRQIAGWQLPGSSARDSVGYDAMGNVAFTRTPLGHYTRYLTDAAGRDTLTISPLDTLGARHIFTRHVLDAMDREVQTVTSSDSSTVGAATTLTVQTFYNPEGSPDSVWTTSGADPTQPGIGRQRHLMTYDALGRELAEVVTGAVNDTVVLKRFTYDAAGNRTNGGRYNGGGIHASFDALNRLVQRTSSSDAAQFTYDGAGHLVSATNRYAQIGRAYYPGGALRTDTLRVAVTDTTVSAPAKFARHVYVDSLGYDRDGRPNVLRLPDGSSAQYAYDPVFGALQTLTGPGGDTFVSQFDLAGRLTQRVRLAGTADSVLERVTYDADSRLFTDSVTGAGNSSAATRAQRLAYDARDRALFASQTSEAFTYAPLGPVVNGITVGGSNETFTVDALGDAYTHMADGVTTTSVYHGGTTRLDQLQTPNGIYTDTTFYSYDTDGNRLGEATWHYLSNASPGFTVNCPKATCVFTSRSFTYDDQNQLVAVHFQTDTSARQSQTPASPYTTDEWTRYDALGRRVWTRFVHSTNCSLQNPVGGCANTLLRSMWNGDQLVYEVQVTASDTVASTEGDTPSGSASYGIVRYLHAADLDAPLAIYKNGTLAVLPFENYRGTVDLLACPRMASCANVPVPGLTDGLNARDGGKSTGPLGFYGTIQGGMKTGSGLVYQRNRYVDPATGKFTQADPLGLAGGLSAWGFVGGDPVTYSDPFGLCPPCYPDQPGGGFGQTRATDAQRVKGLGVLAAITVGIAGAMVGAAEAPILIGRLVNWLGPAAPVAASISAQSETSADSRIPFEGFQDWGRSAVGWGQNAAGAAKAMAEMTAEKAASLDPAKVQAAKAFYETAVANGKGGAAAPARVELMQKILELQK